MIKLALKVLEDEIAEDIVEDFDLERAWAPEAVTLWWRKALSRLEATQAFVAPDLSAAPSVLIEHGRAITITLYLCSRVSMEVFSESPEALGLHLISTPDGDPFGDDTAYARAYRCLMVSDRAEFLSLFADLARDDIDPSRHVQEYLEAWLNTAFHEIAHAHLFATNAGFETPDQVDLLADAGEIAHDIFDMSTGYGIRPLPIAGQLVWAETMDEATEMMETYVETLGKSWMRDVLTDEISPLSYLAAAGIESDIDLILDRASALARNG